ncbi:MAG: hypothetical protein Q8P84_06305 [Deltaproteobacteria bacterium]|nr:hypothetical protein [Deltaproteobacteria bacterium]
MVKQVPTKNVQKSEYKDYQSKGKQFFDVMLVCLQDEEWDAVLLNGIHACISFNDAITTLYLGKRSAGKSHQDCAHLLLQALASPEAKRNADRLIEIINLKNLVEYEPRRFTQTAAHDFSKKVERFVHWAQTLLT